MSLEFEDQYGVLMKQTSLQRKRGKIVTFLLRHRIVRTESGADKLLAVLAGCFFVIAIGILLWYWHAAATPPKAKYIFSKALLERLPSAVQQQIVSE